MYTSIESSQGDKIGRLKLNFERLSEKGILMKSLDCICKDQEVKLILPRYFEADSIDLFGLPPFNEWAIGVEDVKELKRSYPNKEYEEKFSSSIIPPSTAKLKIKRKYRGKKEQFKVTETGMPERKAVT